MRTLCKRGFTIAELMLVIAVIGVIAAVGFFFMTNVSDPHNDYRTLKGANQQ